MARLPFTRATKGPIRVEGAYPVLQLGVGVAHELGHAAVVRRMQTPGGGPWGPRSVSFGGKKYWTVTICVSVCIANEQCADLIQILCECIYC